jgi:hypothetical protein
MFAPRTGRMKERMAHCSLVRSLVASQSVEAQSTVARNDPARLLDPIQG